MSFLFWFQFILFLPIILIQGLWVKKQAIRLPEALGVKRGVKGKGKPFIFSMIGDSVAVGVGISNLEHSIGGAITNELIERQKGQVYWQVIGQSGFTITQLNQRLLNSMPFKPVIESNLTVVSIGVNDVKGFTSVKKWRDEFEDLLNNITFDINHKVIILAIPDMKQFPLLPWPLNSVLASRVKLLNNLSLMLCLTHPQVFFFQYQLEHRSDTFSKDGFHPSEKSCQLLAETIASFYFEKK